MLDALLTFLSVFDNIIRMPCRPVLSVEHQQYVAERYIAGDIPPRELVAELKEKFGVLVKPSALRQWITRSGLAKRKAEVERKTCALASSARTTALAKARAGDPSKHIQEWAERTIGVTQRAFAMAEAAAKPRELASAVSALNTSTRLYRLLVGIDGPGSGGPGAANFNFNFISTVPKKDGWPIPMPGPEVNRDFVSSYPRTPLSGCLAPTDCLAR
jgi:hypothetical protein